MKSTGLCGDCHNPGHERCNRRKIRSKKTASKPIVSHDMVTIPVGGRPTGDLPLKWLIATANSLKIFTPPGHKGRKSTWIHAINAVYNTAARQAAAAAIEFDARNKRSAILARGSQAAKEAAAIGASRTPTINPQPSKGSEAKPGGAAAAASSPPKADRAAAVAFTPPKAGEAAAAASSPPKVSKAAAVAPTPPKQGVAVTPAPTSPKASETAAVESTPPKAAEAPEVAPTPLTTPLLAGDLPPPPLPTVEGAGK